MSKGSARRKGEGYEDGWSRIFGKKAVFSSFTNCKNPRNLLDISKPVQVYEDSPLYRSDYVQCTEPFCQCEPGKCERKEDKEDKE